VEKVEGYKWKTPRTTQDGEILTKKLKEGVTISQCLWNQAL